MHEGHRERMRERFRAEGLDGFAEHEALEMLLFYGHARGNVNPLAHELIDAFGSLKGVLEARPEQLTQVKGVGETTATLISMIVPLFRQYQACVRKEQPCILSKNDAKNYCVSLLAGWRTERFYVICLNAGRRVLGHRLISVGNLTEVSAYPRQVVETALNYNARFVIICHNHPGGTLQPSPDDVEATLQIQRLLKELEIEVIDHIIVSGDAAYSMVQHGDLSYRPPAALGKAADSVGRLPYKSIKEGKA